ncbi:hypothetical protein NUSPORA_01838 [Nucleospora cyclopteri]
MVVNDLDAIEKSSEYEHFNEDSILKPVTKQDIQLKIIFWCLLFFLIFLIASFFIIKIEYDKFDVGFYKKTWQDYRKEFPGILKNADFVKSYNQYFWEKVINKKRGELSKSRHKMNLIPGSAPVLAALSITDPNVEKQDVPGDGSCGFHSILFNMFSVFKNTQSDQHKRLFDWASLRSVAHEDLFLFWAPKAYAIFQKYNKYTDLDSTSLYTLVMYLRIFLSLKCLEDPSGVFSGCILDSDRTEAIQLAQMVSIGEWLELSMFLSASCVLNIDFMFVVCPNQATIYEYMILANRDKKVPMPNTVQAYLMLSNDSHFEPLVYPPERFTN